MSVSKEVQMAVDEIRRERDALRAAAKANELQAAQLADLRGQVSALQAGAPLSEDDKKALLDAINEAGETNEAISAAVPANVPAVGVIPANGPVPPTPPEHNPDAPRPDPIVGTGQNGTVPLMPNMAFDPSAGNRPVASDGGQPQQAPVIETAGGFVVSGGGNTARAPGSKPESPSSSVVIPDDPDAKAPVSTADEVKSGLGDSSQNAMLGNDGQPVADGPGMPREPSPQVAQREQDRQDALADERARREANPLNLSPEDLQKQQDADAGKGTRDDKAKDISGTANASPTS